MEFAELIAVISPLMFTSCIVLILHRQTAITGNSKLFREYIGVDYRGVRLSDVPINAGVEFHFILSFAMDYTTTSDGQFNVFWDADRLSDSAVADIKRRNPNVKVAISLGWDDLNGVAAYFAVEWVDAWVENAVASLLIIIDKYQIDGVDINYRRFNGTDLKIFTDSIGKLVTRLKNLGAISFASIAPFEDPEIQRYCDEQSLNYSGGKVLVGFMSNQEEGLTPDDGFFKSCHHLHNDFKFEVEA